MCVGWVKGGGQERIPAWDFKRLSGMWPILYRRVRPQLCRKNGTLLPLEPSELRTGPSFRTAGGVGGGERYPIELKIAR